MVKSFLSLMIAVTFFANVCLAQNGKKSCQQARPNFSGLWVINQSESKITGFNFEITSDLVLEVIHREPEIKFITKVKEGGQYVVKKELTYYTDGRGEMNGEKSVTKWDGKKLVTKIADKNTEIRRELSPDGSKLIDKTVIKTTVTFRGIGNAPEQKNTLKSEIKFVYDRAPST